MYQFKWKRVKSLFYNKRTVVGHKFFPEMNKMVLYYANGGLEEIAEWSHCGCVLGGDWALAVKKEMESKAGQSIPVNLG